MLKALFAFVILTIASAASAIFWAQDWWSQKATQLKQPIEMTIKEGSTIHGVSTELHKLGLISYEPRLFVLGWRITMPHSTLKAGDYRFEGELTPLKIARILTTGQTVTISFTIPEGWNMYQIAERLQTIFPKTPKEQWLVLMRDKKLLETLPGQPPTAEGFLFPETYTFNPRAQPQDVLAAMIQEFRKNFTPQIVAQGEQLKLSPLAIVTLASIIEKETGKAEERPHISSVFHNRLRIGMRLQTDPTVIYGMWERYDGNIRKDDLRTPTPYNTYVISGLPPGPIASAGLAALKAAVEPLQTEDLYFVSRGDGSHIFSTNLRDHQKSVYQYQIRPAKNKSAQN